MEFIATFTISSDGASITEISELEHETSKADFNSLEKVDSDTYALAYSGPDDDGFITTFTVASNGSSITEVATVEHNTSDASFNSLIQVDSDTYVLAYSGTGEDGFIATFTISSNGATITEVDEIEHDTEKGRYNSVVQVDSDTYALAYAGLNSDGFIKTFSIQSDGTLPVELTSFELLETRNNGITFNGLRRVRLIILDLTWIGRHLSQTGVRLPVMLQDSSSITRARQCLSPNYLHLYR